MGHHQQKTINAITVDVEDWVQSVFDPELPLTDRFVRNTQRILELFDAHNVHATFFVLGLAAQKSPQLVREIQQAGHEIQSHGYGHRLIFNQTPQQFREDVTRSKKLLEDIIGEPICGYRAPAFSITEKTLWALDVLVDCGFEFDSSIFPMKMKRYGMDGVPTYPHQLKTPSGRGIVEIPVATCHWLGKKWSIGGGGYFRLLPYPILQRGIRQINRSGQPATIYMHPYEFAAKELHELPQRIPLKQKLHQGLGRPGFATKIEKLLSDFHFAPIQSMIDAQADLSQFNLELDVSRDPSLLPAI